MNSTNFLNNIQDKEEFINNIKDKMDVTAFNALNIMKKDLASDFIKGDNNETTKSEK